MKKKKKKKSPFDLIAKDINDVSSFEDEEELIYIPTIFNSFNRAIKIGGAPVGCIWEIHGPGAGGKTSFGIGILISALKKGHYVAFSDVERAGNKKWAKYLGLDLEKCIYINPKNFEDGSNGVNKMIMNFHEAQLKGKIPEDKLLFILKDSATSMVPKQEQEGLVGAKNYGLQANLMSQWMKIATPLIGKTKVCLMIINQERVNVGRKPWEPEFKSTCGEALSYYASVRIRIKLAGEIKENIDGEKISVGKRHRFLVEKNKVGYPDEEGYFYTSNGKGECKIGFDRTRELLTEAINRELIWKGKVKIKGQEKERYISSLFEETFAGERKLRLFLRENKDIRKVVRKALLK